MSYTTTHNRVIILVSPIINGCYDMGYSLAVSLIYSHSMPQRAHAEYVLTNTLCIVAVNSEWKTPYAIYQLVKYQ